MKHLPLLLTLLLIFALGCGPKSAGSASGKITAVATTAQVADIVRNVGGDQVEVQALMGPGTDPHLYKATARDVERLSSAKIVFYNGLELEGRMSEIFASMSKSGTPTVAVAEAVPTEMLRQPEEFEGKYDPHVWFDITMWIHCVDAVEAALAELDPDHAEEYKERAEAYRQELRSLDGEVRSLVSEVPEDQRVLVTAHDAFGYFGTQYGFELEAIQGTSTVSEASVSQIRSLADLIAERKIKAIFVESSVPQNTIEALQEAVKSRGWTVEIGGELYSDAMGDEGTEEGTYIGMFRYNVRTIVEALK